VKGYGLTSRPGIEVLSAYSAPQTDIESVATTPGWHVVGAFKMPLTAELRLELIGFVSGAGLTLRARFFDVTAGAPVASSEASTTATTDTIALGPVVTLTGGHLYQIQAECTGGGAPEQIATVRAAAPTV
jgi:hypothetical protein